MVVITMVLAPHTYMWAHVLNRIYNIYTKFSEVMHRFKAVVKTGFRVVVCDVVIK